MKLEPASKSKAYTSFILLRDKALEKLLINANAKVNDELRAVFTRVLESIIYRYSAIPKDSIKTNKTKFFLHTIEVLINSEFHKSAETIETIYKNLVKRAYLLSAVGEAEAVYRTTGKKTAVYLTPEDLRQLVEKSLGEEHIFDKIYISFSKLSKNLMTAIEYSRIRGEDRDALTERLLRVLPKSKRVKRPKRALKPVVREAEKKIRTEFGDAFIPEDEWQAMVEDYLEEYTPSSRGPSSVFDLDIGDEEMEEIYGWEIEKNMAHDFVKSVRQAAEDGNAMNGITEFSIIAVIDDHTCDSCCGNYGCYDFDGLTTGEVEKLTKGEQSTPPFHFNCRCTMAPMLDNMPEVEESNQEEFLQWLNS